MAGQQQINNYDLESIYQKYSKQLEKQVESEYIYNHFRVGKTSEIKLFEAFLFEKYLCSDNCNFINFFNNKIFWEDNKFDFYEGLKKIDNSTNNTTINNYFVYNNGWDKVEW